MKKLEATKAQVKRLYLRSARARTMEEKARLWKEADRAFEAWDLSQRAARKASLLTEVADQDIGTMSMKRFLQGAVPLLQEVQRSGNARRRR